MLDVEPVALELGEKFRVTAGEAFARDIERACGGSCCALHAGGAVPAAESSEELVPLASLGGR